MRDRAYGCIRSLHTRTNLYTDTIRKVCSQTGHFFHSLIVQWRCWRVQTKHKALCRAFNLTLLVIPVLQFATIWGSFAALSHLKIIAIHLWFRLYKFFYRQFWCSWFVVLLDTWYSRNTRENVVCVIPNIFANMEILWPLSCASTTKFT